MVKRPHLLASITYDARIIHGVRSRASNGAAPMTYGEARRWLAKIGGEWVEGKEMPRKGSVIVSVRSARGPMVSRRAVFDDALEGYRREFAIQEAFLEACKELKRALW